MAYTISGWDSVYSRGYGNRRAASASQWSTIRAEPVAEVAQPEMAPAGATPEGAQAVVPTGPTAAAVQKAAEAVAGKSNAKFLIGAVGALVLWKLLR